MSEELQLLFVIGSTFLAVALAVAVVGFQVSQRARIRERLAAGAVAAPSSLYDRPQTPPKAALIQEKWLGLDPEKKSKLRLDLIRAGFFTPEAPTTFIVTRAVLVIALPIFGYLLLPPLLPKLTAQMPLVIAGILFVLAYLGPDAFLKRRQEANVTNYRNAFPDFLDLVLVCVDAGLSLEAALERVSNEMFARDKNFGTNLALMGSEMRAGRSTADALDGLAERLALEEAQSFSMLLRQSIDLGTDTSDALRTFSEEMREKRLSRAEAKAYALPVKLVVPLGLFIFPVLMIAILTPAMLKVSKALQVLVGGG